MLAAGWLPLCRVDQLVRSGDGTALTLLARPLLAVHDGDVIQVFSNVCAHRGSTIVEEGPSAGSTVVCPYHRWAYRLDGSLIGAPLAEGVDLEGVCLSTVRHGHRGKGSCSSTSPVRLPPHTMRSPVCPAAIEPWRWLGSVTVATKRFESTWNWKIMVENWDRVLADRSAPRLRRAFPAHTKPPRGAERWRSPWTAMTVDSLDGIEGPADEWMPGIDASSGRRCGLGCVSTPARRQRCPVRLLVAGRPDRRRPARRDLAPRRPSNTIRTLRQRAHCRADGDAQQRAAEDIAAWARVQAGVASGLLDRLRLTSLEYPIADFQRWITNGLRV